MVTLPLQEDIWQQHPKQRGTNNGITQKHRQQVTAQEGTVGEARKAYARARTTACATDVSNQEQKSRRTMLTAEE
jgi:hypothetical protein